MKKNILLLTFIFFKVLCGQDMIQKPITIAPTPEASNFINYYITPAVSATGTMNIKIPIHEIIIDDIKLPIELNYHTGGIKVNDLSGSVGLGWSLNAGGGIYRSINNMADEKYSDNHHTYLSSIYNLEELIPGNGSVYTFNNQAKLQSISSGSSDLNPDNYSYSFLNFSGGLYFDNNKVFKNDNSEALDFSYSSNKLETFTVYDDIGSTYLFKENEYSSSAFSSTNKTSWKLNEIKTNKNNRIKFEYSKYNSSFLNATHSFLYRIKVLPEQSNGGAVCLNDKDNFQNVYSQVNNGNLLIDKIQSDDQTIIFKYSDNLNAVDWRRKLDYIEIYNRDNELIKKIELKYKIAKGDKRLLLYEVNFKSIDSNLEYKYQLQYNELDSSPFTNTLNKDLFNYYNFANNTTLLKLEQGNLGDALGYVSVSYYNANREPNINGAKVNSLNKITYPTGGSMNIDYSLNVENNKYSPGLRVNKVELIDSDNTLQKTTSFIYKNLFGNINRHSDVIINNNPVNTLLWQSVNCFNFNSENRMQNQFLPSNFYYKEIIIKEQYQEKVQTIIERYSEPNIDTETDALNGYILKPQLVEKVYYNGSLDLNDIVKREKYVYETMYIPSIPTFKYELLSPYYSNEIINGNMVACINFYPGLIKMQSQRPKWFRLKYQEEELLIKNTSTNIVTNKKYYYNNHFGKYVSKNEFIDSKGDTTINSFKYSWDLINENLDPSGIYSDMVLNRFIKYPIISTTRKNSSFQRVQNEFLKNNIFGWYNISKIEHFKNSQLASEESFIKYDHYGNNVVYKNNYNPQQITIWGYSGKYPVLIIKNSSYQELVSIVGEFAIDELNNLSKSSYLIDAEIDKLAKLLRFSLPHAEITSLTYKPLLGLSSKTNARGVTEYYKYDSFGRLFAILDYEGNILKTFCYNYKNQIIDCESAHPIITYSNVSKSRNFTKQGCPSGYRGSIVNYTVAAGKYKSFISQYDADEKANMDIIINGQEFANINGSCVQENCKKVELIVPISLINTLYVRYTDCNTLQNKIEPLNSFEHDYTPDHQGRITFYLCVGGTNNYIGLRNGYNGNDQSFINVNVNWIGPCN